MKNYSQGAGNTLILPIPPQSTIAGLPKPVAPAQQQSEPDTPLSFEPDPLPPPRPPWYIARCNFTGRSFGGRFTGAEIDYIASVTKGWELQVSPNAFGYVAESAIKACKGVAA